MKPTIVLLLLLLVLIVAVPAASAQTTNLTVIRYGWDNKTVEESQTVNVSWMENNLPVYGDGATPYLLQGPTLNLTNLWDPAEDTNLDKINETLKGTSIRDLVDLVGGMQPGDEVQVRAVDGLKKRLNYTNIYKPQARQGPAVVAWWNARNGYAWPESMRLFFLADNSTNPQGVHVFGNEDMRQCLAEKYWTYQYDWGIYYPSSASLSVKYVAYLEIYPGPRALAVPGSSKVPTDIDGDGLCEDINGDGVLDFNDVVLYFNQMDWIADNEPVSLFDYNGNGEIDFNDVIWLFNRV
ncbi:hypothetical protein [Methanosphaerula palustris]|uniref:Dockerin domain-containing protein n=1 Tax=Methanosphaerula palustris (strain ATCC BAA-1556 / DSM 19958 / E1-9c) TaxID=521011 RepID=B8GG27_METPE|nr:hypothetical protein [Methanosphaerula palustris]ACL16101.1 hypothetical protein Mpal_0737 [Methanosphaerula palustris E1-9c]